MNAKLQKRALHLAVRFYRVAGLELVLVPLVDDVASFVRMAGDGYVLVALSSPPGTSYPLKLDSPASFDEQYLESKFRLNTRGSGCTPAELAAALRLIAEDLEQEARMD